jgi:hypothetical protein
VDGLNFEDYNDKNAFGDIYEKILKDLQSACDSGEFYTPRAVTDFMAQMEVVNFCGVFSIFHDFEQSEKFRKQSFRCFL